MEHAAKALPSAWPASTQTQRTASTAENGRSSRQSEQIMRRLWLRMTEIYGHKWTSAYGEDAGSGAGVTWAKGLAGLGPQDIADGVEAALISSDEWPPTLPKFRAMCFGIPTLGATQLWFSKNTTDSQWCRLIASYLDMRRLRESPWDKADKMVKTAYELAVAHVMAGGELPEERVALPAPEPAKSPEYTDSELSSIREKAAEARRRCAETLGIPLEELSP